MDYQGATRMSFARSFGEIVLREAEDATGPRLEIVECRNGVEKRLLFRADELERLEAGVRECRRRLAGHERHVRGVDEVLK